VPAHLAHALLQCVHAGMYIGKAAAIGIERQLAAGAVLLSAMKAQAALRGTGLSSPPRRRGSRACPSLEQGATSDATPWGPPPGFAGDGRASA
jgi:hypothetical protein